MAVWLPSGTRCIRFTSEICGLAVLGTTGRGNAMEVGTYVDQQLDSELSGNVIDLCPVGALTSKPYSFSTRPWELVRTESIDTLDAVGSAIRIDSRGPEVMRVLPRLYEEVNEEWIGDKARFSYDGLKRQRIDSPLRKQGDVFAPISWSAALLAVRDRLRGLSGDELLGVVGEQADAEAIVALKDWFASLGSSSLVSTQHPLPFSASSPRSSYLFASTIAGVEQADCVLLLNCNPRMEAAVISARLRKSVRLFSQQIFSLGPQLELNIPHLHVGDSLADLRALARSGGGAAGDGEDEAQQARAAFSSAKRPMVIVGMGAFRDAATGAGVLQALEALVAAFPALRSDGWNGVNILHSNASAVAALDLGVGLADIRPRAAKFVYLLGADGLHALRSASLLSPDAFVVYAGSHGDEGASMADIVLPSPAYTEKSGTFVNTEGRVQRTKAAVGRLAEAREDWQIIRALSELSGRALPYASIEQVRDRLQQLKPHFAQLQQIGTDAAAREGGAGERPEPQQPQPGRSSVSPSSSAVFEGLLDNYFLTNPISRASPTMAKCSRQLPTAANSYSSRIRSSAQQPLAADSARKLNSHTASYPH